MAVGARWADGVFHTFATDIMTTIAWVFRRMFQSNGWLKTKVEHLVPPIYLLVARTDKVSLKRRSGSSGSVLQKGLQKKSRDSVARSDETKCTYDIFRASTEIRFVIKYSLLQRLFSETQSLLKFNTAPPPPSTVFPPNSG